jgi:hypothetical protein
MRPVQRPIQIKPLTPEDERLYELGRRIAREATEKVAEKLREREEAADDR